MTKSSENGTEHLIEFVEKFIRKKTKPQIYEGQLSPVQMPNKAF